MLLFVVVGYVCEFAPLVGPFSFLAKCNKNSVTIGYSGKPRKRFIILDRKM